jgi:hypothetical protein
MISERLSVDSSRLLADLACAGQIARFSPDVYILHEVAISDFIIQDLLINSGAGSGANSTEEEVGAFPACHCSSLSFLMVSA